MFESDRAAHHASHERMDASPLQAKEKGAAEAAPSTGRINLNRIQQLKLDWLSAKSVFYGKSDNGALANHAKTSPAGRAAKDRNTESHTAPATQHGCADARVSEAQKHPAHGALHRAIAHTV